MDDKAKLTSGQRRALEESFEGADDGYEQRHGRVSGYGRADSFFARLREMGMVEQRLVEGPERRARLAKEIDAAVAGARAALDDGEWLTAMARLNEAHGLKATGERKAWYATEAGRKAVGHACAACDGNAG
jgi:hypothetical protein